MSESKSDLHLDRVVIQSYLDGELDGADLNEFERQLSESDELRAALDEAEAEHLELRALLRPPSAPAALRARIADELDLEDRRGRRSRLRTAMAWSLPGASVAAAAAALALFVFGTPGGYDASDDDNVARAAVRQRIRAKIPTPASNPPSHSEVSASLARYFDSPVSPPRFATGDVKLDSWRPSSLKGHEAAQLQYSVTSPTGRHLVTVHILDAKNLEVRGQRRVDIAGRTMWVDSPFGFSALSYRDERGIAYVFTSEMSETELIDLVVSSDILHRIGERLR